MANTRARVFMSGRSQHVTIPREFRFHSSEVSIRRDPESGDLILSEAPSLADVFAALDQANLPKNFLNDTDRDRRPSGDRAALRELFDEKPRRNQKGAQ